MGWLGPGEIIVILILVLVFFGPHKLPEIGRAIGKGMRDLRKFSDVSNLEETLTGEEPPDTSKPLPDVPDPSGDDGVAGASDLNNEEEYAAREMRKLQSSNPPAGEPSAPSQREDQAKTCETDKNNHNNTPG